MGPTMGPTRGPTMGPTMGPTRECAFVKLLRFNTNNLRKDLTDITTYAYNRSYWAIRMGTFRCHIDNTKNNNGFWDIAFVIHNMIRGYDRVQKYGID